jgi:hypothetical protein
MKIPSEEEFTQLAAKALAQSGSAALNVLEIEDADICVVVRTPTRVEWNAYLDAAIQADSTADARWNGVCRWALWPSRADIQTARASMADLPAKICDGAEELAGRAKVHKLELARDTSADDLAEFGISSDVAGELLARYPHRGQLRVVKTDEFVGVLKRPTSTTYEALKNISRVKDGYSEASYNAVVDCMAWPEETALRATFDRLPALAFVLAPHVLEMGGSGAAVKKRRR